MQHAYPRTFNFESVSNFRDLGGYQTLSGHTVAWRKLFRSGDLHNITRGDLEKLRDEIKVTSVIDLRSSIEIGERGRGIISETNIKYFNVAVVPEITTSPRKPSEPRFQGITNMGEVYLNQAVASAFGKGIIEALNLIAEPENYPLLFCCSAGRDRSGMLAAILLSILDVAQEDIVADYCLSNYNAEVLLRSREMPEWYLKTQRKSMDVFLSGINSKYGSVRGYVIAQGANSSLFHRLEKALLV
jgi:protein-tyrosine phosphatase